MTPEKIQYELKRRKVTQRDIALQLKCSENHVSRVIRGFVTSHRVMAAVAKAIGRPQEIVFSEYFTSPGRRGPRQAING